MRTGASVGQKPAQQLGGCYEQEEHLLYPVFCASVPQTYFSFKKGELPEYLGKMKHDFYLKFDTWLMRIQQQGSARVSKKPQTIKEFETKTQSP